MTTTTTMSTAIAVAEPVFTTPEPLALAGFLAGYTGLTREAYALDLRQFTGWRQQHYLHPFQVRRADIECFAAQCSTPPARPGRQASSCACRPEAARERRSSHRHPGVPHKPRAP
jgi:hypothetical protein